MHKNQGRIKTKKPLTNNPLSFLSSGDHMLYSMPFQNLEIDSIL